RSPRICVLGRTFTIDEESSRNRYEESSSDEAHDIPKDLTPVQEESNGGVKYKKTPYPFEEKWSTESELSQRLHQKISKKLSGDRSSMSSLDEPKSGRSLHSFDRVSIESRNSVDTESSSGSLGAATR